MRKLHPEHPPMKERDLFRFGKYRGRPLWKVLSEDPAYVAWLLDNLPGFTLAPDVRDYLAHLRQCGLGRR